MDPQGLVRTQGELRGLRKAIDAAKEMQEALKLLITSKEKDNA